MAYELIYRPDLTLVYVRFRGHLALADVRRCAVEVFRDPRYQPGLRELYDLRAATGADARLGFDALHEIHETQDSWIRNLRRGGQAVLVASGDLLFGLCRIYASLADRADFPVTPCRDWAAACRLLGIDPQTAFAAAGAEG